MMAKETLGEVSLERQLILGLIGLVLLSLSGCAAGHPKPAETTVTPEQVRSHADKTFDKMKQEEQHRTDTPAMSP